MESFFPCAVERQEFFSGELGFRFLGAAAWWLYILGGLLLVGLARRGWLGHFGRVER